MTLTAERVRQTLNYDPETGEFTWRIKKQRGVVGKSANILKVKENGKRYFRIELAGKLHPAHRLAWFYTFNRWPVDEIDHLNGNGLDNRLANLREVVKGENAKNARLRADNVSGVTGVCRHKSTGKWQAQIKVNGQARYLGLFSNKQDAVEAVKKAHEANGFHPNHGTSRPL